MSHKSKAVIAGKVIASMGVPAIPILSWWKSAHDDRLAHTHSVETKIRVPNIQTVDDLLIEKCQPGDVVVFDRRCDRCAAGPLAALSCIVGRNLLSKSDHSGERAVETGVYDHVGIVVPGKDDLDELHLLEATSGDGIVSRPLLRRLEMSRSRNVTLLPLSSAGEYRNSDSYEPSDKTIRLRNTVEDSLSDFRDKSVKSSQDQQYHRIHSLVSITGAFAYVMNLHEFTPLPVSPSSWLVVCALQAATAGENIEKRAALNAKVEDFFLDHRFHEKDVVRLRPGWKFLPPVTMRESAVS